jgi:hypothetical protein
LESLLISKSSRFIPLRLACAPCRSCASLSSSSLSDDILFSAKRFSVLFTSFNSFTPDVRGSLFAIIAARACND